MQTNQTQFNREDGAGFEFLADVALELDPEVTWVVEHHGAFQLYYYAHHYGWDRMEREKYRGSPYFQSCLDFCERWDQSSFDPDYATDSRAVSSRSDVEPGYSRKAG